MALPFLQRELHIKFTVGQLLLLFAWLLAFVYAGWEYYWFTQVDWYFVKWHTHLAPYALFLLLLLTIAQWVRINDKTLMIVSSVCVGLMMAEALLYAIDPKADVMFYGQFRTNPKNYYNTWPPYKEHRLKNIEFDYPRQTNSLGFSDREWSITKDSNKIRVLALGDSFTEGDAAPADSAYPILMQQVLGENYEVMNAGACGSDPIFNYKNLEDRLLKYQPDVVVQTISSHDLFKDIPLRGGFERFLPDGTLHPNPTPAWFYPAMVSIIFRKFIKLFELDEYTPIIINEAFLNKLEGQQRQLIGKYDSLGAGHNFNTIFVLLPLIHETQHNNYDYDFTPLLKMTDHTSTIHTLDLMPCYQQEISRSGNNYETFYWKIDPHHNSTGYKMMAECIAGKIQELTKMDSTLRYK